MDQARKSVSPSEISRRTSPQSWHHWRKQAEAFYRQDDRTRKWNPHRQWIKR